MTTWPIIHFKELASIESVIKINNLWVYLSKKVETSDYDEPDFFTDFPHFGWRWHRASFRLICKETLLRALIKERKVDFNEIAARISQNYYGDFLGDEFNQTCQEVWAECFGDQRQCPEIFFNPADLFIPPSLGIYLSNLKKSLLTFFKKISVKVVINPPQTNTTPPL